MVYISTKGRYALRVMIDLAEQNSEKFIPLAEIAERQGLSKKYLESILKTLVKNNFLEISKGRHGGYKLTRSPLNYNIEEILEITEGTLAPVSCLQKGCEPCKRKDICKTLPMWKDYDRMSRAFFSSLTLQDLIGEWKNVESLKI